MCLSISPSHINFPQYLSYTPVCFFPVKKRRAGSTPSFLRFTSDLQTDNSYSFSRFMTALRIIGKWVYLSLWQPCSCIHCQRLTDPVCFRKHCNAQSPPSCPACFFDLSIMYLSDSDFEHHPCRTSRSDFALSSSYYPSELSAWEPYKLPTFPLFSHSPWITFYLLIKEEFFPSRIALLIQQYFVKRFRLTSHPIPSRTNRENDNASPIRQNIGSNLTTDHLWEWNGFFLTLLDYRY